MDARIDRTTLQEDGLHYHVYRPMPAMDNSGMITHYMANPEPIASRTTANREAKEKGLPFMGAPAMVRQCRAPYCRAVVCPKPCEKGKGTRDRGGRA